jgi:hypothetical protein
MRIKANFRVLLLAPATARQAIGFGVHLTGGNTQQAATHYYVPQHQLRLFGTLDNIQSVGKQEMEEILDYKTLSRTKVAMLLSWTFAIQNRWKARASYHQMLS